MKPSAHGSTLDRASIPLPSIVFMPSTRVLVVAPVPFAFLTYAAFLRLEPKALDWAAQVLKFDLFIGCFWATVVMGIAALLFIRRHPRLTTGSLILTALILWPVAETAV